MKVIMKQVGDFNKSTTRPGLFFSPNEEDLTKNNRVLVIGPRYPKQTETDYSTAKYPYEECLFFFDMGFERDYPNSSPNMKFINSYMFADNFRYHPNFYQSSPDKSLSGKVCLSILGTFPGPGWSNTMTIESTLATIQSIIGPNPVKNEPGYYYAPEKVVSNYNHAVCYRSIKYTIDIYNKILKGNAIHENIEPFLEDIKARMFHSLKFFIKKLANLKRYNPGTFQVSSMHHNVGTINYGELYNEVVLLNVSLPIELQVDRINENSSLKQEENMRAAALAERLNKLGGWPTLNTSKSVSNTLPKKDNAKNELKNTQKAYEIAAKNAELKGDSKLAKNLRKQALELEKDEEEEYTYDSD